jgi:hypothetical protein
VYNDKQKQTYLDFEGVNTDSLKRYFIRIEPKEEEHQKDISQMNQEELIDTLQSLNIRREESRGHLLSLMRGYINWVKLHEHGAPNLPNSINTITPESIGSDSAVKDTMIKNPEHLQSLLDDGLDYINYENRSKITKLLFWLLYQGILLEDMPSLRKDSIDYSNYVIKVSNNKTYQIDDKTIKLWKDCVVISYIEKKNGRSIISKRSDTNEYSKYDLIDNEYLFRPIVGNKGYTNQKSSIHTIRKMLSGVFEACDMKSIPARNINYSGIFYKIYLREKEGEKITPEIIAEYFTIKYKDRVELIANTRKWRIDYEDWKIAFDYI